MIITIRRFTVACAAIATSLLLAPASTARAAIAPAESLLPADTLAFFTVPDANAFRAACKTSPQIMCWNDPAMQPFHDKLMTKFNEKFVAPIEKDLGLKVADFLALPQGQFTLAITVNGSNGHDAVAPGLILLLDAKAQSDLLKTNLTALTKKWKDAGRKLRTETLHGLSFTVVPLNSNDFAGILPKKAPVSEIGKDAKPDPTVEVYFTQYQSLLVAASSVKAAEVLAAHLTGSSLPAVADDATFAGDKLSQFRDAPVYYGWFNATKTFDLITASSSPSGDDATPSAMPQFAGAKILGATGLGGLKSASFAVREKPEGSTIALHLTAPEATRTGLLKILALPAKDAGIPAFVPADATKFTRVRLDGKQTWAELQKMVAVISPQGLAGLNSVIDMANTLAQVKDPGFDLRANLFGNLGDDIVVYGKAPVGDSLTDFGNPPAIYLVAVSNPEQVINAVKNLASLAAPQDTAPAPRDFVGHKIYSIAQRGQVHPDGSTAAPSYLYLASAGGYVAISKTTTILEEYLRSADGKLKPLNETPGIADAAGHVGGTHGGLFSYENQRETMRAAFKFMKLSATDNAATKMFPPAFRDWADFSLLPDFDAVSKYFYLSVFGGTADADGLTLKVYAPRPPQLN